MPYSLKIDNIMFLSKMDAVDGSINAFTPNSGALPEIRSSAVALQNYRERFMALTEVLQLYKDLLVQDAATIRAMGKSLNQVDQDLADSILQNNFLLK